MSLTSDTLGERIKQRSEHVALNAEQRRATKELNTDATENFDFFDNHFQIMKTNLETKINESKDVPSNEISDFLDSMVKDVAKMQHFLNDSSMFLPSFWIKKIQEVINEKNEAVLALVDELQPKKKFGFKAKKKVDAPKATPSKDLSKSEDQVDLAGQLKEKSFFGFKDKVGETLHMTAEELKDRQFHLQNLTDCKVIALGNPGSLQFANLKNTVVIVGPTSRSGFIKHCTDCKFALACQQIRIHNCEDTDFYVHVTASAIIEGCRTLCFAPYTVEYEEKDSQFAQSGLSLQKNCWDKVEDFHWLNENEKSPNFNLIEESSWKRDWL